MQNPVKYRVLHLYNLVIPCSPVSGRLIFHYTKVVLYVKIKRGSFVYC